MTGDVMDLETTKTHSLETNSAANAAHAFAIGASIDAGTETLPRASDPEPNAMSFDSWAAQPVPRKSHAVLNRESIDMGALKIFLILAGLTAGMALALRSLF